MNKRPITVTVVCWLLMISAVFSAISSTISLNNPMVKDMMAQSAIPLSVQYLIMYVGLLVMFIGGFFMLKGKNWARLLYVIWGGLGLMIGALTSPVKTMMIPGATFFIVVVILLFLPNANVFFKQNS